MAFNKYQVIKGALSYELANFIFNYFLLKRDAVAWMYQNNITYDEFEKAILNYRKITKDLHSNMSMAKHLYQRNLFKELINFKLLENNNVLMVSQPY